MFKREIPYYLLFWAPAAVLSFVPLADFSFILHLILGWLSAILLLVGWLLVTKAFTFNAPTKALSVILIYVGVHALVISSLYGGLYPSVGLSTIQKVLGIFSYTPLFIVTELAGLYRLPAKLIALGAVVLFLFVGFLLGLHDIKKNPYDAKERGIASLGEKIKQLMKRK